MNETSLFHSAITRRVFLRRAAGVAGLAALPVYGVDQPFRAAIIGHTGRGNFGHDHDLIFNDRSNIKVVGVADGDAAGRAKAAARCHAPRQYADYREMLEAEKPELVCVAPRWTDQHCSMALAALQVGAHVYMEKPITRTLAEADELLAVAGRRKLRIVVAHQMRLAPNILALKRSIDQGLVGELLEIRSHGKQDGRAGGEDLVVLGVHLFDLMRLFAGDPLWCAARVLQKGHEITQSDAHPATEDIGPVAGDEITAEFAFPNGVQATFVSRARNGNSAGPWGVELIATKGRIRILMEMIPRIYLSEESAWTPTGRKVEWRLWEEDPTLDWGQAERGFPAANARVVDDWLAAIAEDRQPVCSGQAGMKALEMAMAVFRSGLTRGRVAFPLEIRQHPLPG